MCDISSQALSGFSQQEREIERPAENILVRASMIRRLAYQTLVPLSLTFSLFSFLFSLLLSTAVGKIPEGVVVGFQIFAWAPKKK